MTNEESKYKELFRRFNETIDLANTVRKKVEVLGEITPDKNKKNFEENKVKQNKE